ncbi:MAG: HAMP domain-containing protein [Nitrospira sp.]|nr:HAMP domain-containing protein [Nitrospira sp.]
MLVLVGAVILVHLASMLAYRESAVDAANEAHSAQLASRLATARRVLADRPPDDRDRVAHELSSAAIELRWDRRPVTEASVSADARLYGLAGTVVADIPELAPADIRLEYGNVHPAGDAHAVLGALRLPDDTWLNFTLPVVTTAEPNLRGVLLSTTLMAGGLAGVAILLVRTVTAPLRNLARAADAIGRGPPVQVAETGPEEVRHVGRAFNTMQVRIQRLIADRTQALAAVSHDLRTPITRLRLRAGFVEDPEAQAAIDADLDEMEAMIDATLAYLRGDTEPERPHSVDLSSMLMTLVDSAVDAGHCATFEGPQHAFVTVHALATKRAFANLIDNALSYGGMAQVFLQDEGASVTVLVDDGGPGIPPEELERVFEPFHRLDGSRNRRTGGIGLGLAIVRQAIIREGATVELLNRPEGGLRAKVVIPRRSMGASERPGTRQQGTASAPPTERAPT